MKTEGFEMLKQPHLTFTPLSVSQVEMVAGNNIERCLILNRKRKSCRIILEPVRLTVFLNINAQ